MLISSAFFFFFFVSKCSCVKEKRNFVLRAETYTLSDSDKNGSTQKGPCLVLQLMWYVLSVKFACLCKIVKTVQFCIQASVTLQQSLGNFQVWCCWFCLHDLPGTHSGLQEDLWTTYVALEIFLPGWSSCSRLPSCGSSFMCYSWQLKLFKTNSWAIVWPFTLLGEDLIHNVDFSNIGSKR